MQLLIKPPTAKGEAARHPGRRIKTRRSPVVQPNTYRLVPLTRGGVASVDIEDFDAVRLHNWHLSGSGYALRTRRFNGKRRDPRMHRFIAERMFGRPLKPGEQIDHRDRDRLNNRRSNLRIANRNQNSFNAKYSNSLNLKGVSRSKSSFKADIVAYRTYFYLGSFRSPLEAAWIRDQWALHLHGEFAVLNFDYVEVPRQDKK